MPICSELIECSTPIEKLLPSLTSAAWSRGLGNIIRAQNIRTVGNLSALSEAQIECLPIRSPKVEVVKKVLRKFQSQKIKLEEKEMFRKAIPSTGKELFCVIFLFLVTVGGIYNSYWFQHVSPGGEIRKDYLSYLKLYVSKNTRISSSLLLGVY